MAGWNTGTEETGMSVQNVHVIHVGHWADGYCYPCNDKQHSCSGGPATAGAVRVVCRCEVLAEPSNLPEQPDLGPEAGEGLRGRPPPGVGLPRRRCAVPRSSTPAIMPCQA